MKLIKKSLIITSALALAIIASGCTKKSKLVSDGYVSKLPTVTKLNTLEKKGEVIASSYTVLNNRFIQYKSEKEEIILYDYMQQKEVFKSTENITSINLDSDNVAFIITYDNGDKEVRLTNSQVLVERGSYITLSLSSIKSTYTYKQSNYKEIFISTQVHTAGKYDVKYYKIAFRGVKNAEKKIVCDNDPNNYVVTEVAEADVRSYKGGDNVISDNKSYSYNNSGNRIVFYNSSNNKALLQMNYASDYTASIILNNTYGFGLVQLSKSAVMGEYDVQVNDEKYFVLTYKVDLEKGTYEKLDNFNYFIRNCTSSNVKDNITVFNAYAINSRIGYAGKNIVLDKNLKVVQDSAKYAYATSYTNLGNGNYVSLSSGLIYLTDSKGIIKKMFSGNSYYIFEDAKVISIILGNKITFIDFKGNYITDEVISANNNYITKVSGNKLFYTSVKDSKNHLITFGDKKIEKDEEIEYSLNSAQTSISNISSANEKAIYNSYDKGYYYKAEKHDNNGDTLYDDFTLTFYDRDDVEFGTIEKIYATSYRYIYTDDEGMTCHYFIAFKDNDATTTAIQFYEVK